MARIPSEELVRSPRKNRIVILEELNFIWDEPELREITCLWNEEMTIPSIANIFKRDPDEVFLALIHLARKGIIKTRKSGLRGEEK